jgi:ribosome-associated protein
MRTATGASKRSAPRAEPAAKPSAALLKLVVEILDDAKAENVVTIDLLEKSSMGDYMVIATGRTDRHVGAIADQLQRKLKDEGWGNARVEGEKQCDWVLIDMGAVIVHVFRPEVREFYNLEKMWSQDRAPEPKAH